MPLQSLNFVFFAAIEKSQDGKENRKRKRIKKLKKLKEREEKGKYYKTQDQKQIGTYRQTTKTKERMLFKVPLFTLIQCSRDQLKKKKTAII